jgi:uncharacterized protein YkwD/uncharacterized membrane protein required for colicin V production
VSPIEWGLVAIVGVAALAGLFRGAVRGVTDLAALAIGAASVAFAIPWADERLVGYGVNSRWLLIVIAAALLSLVTALSGLALRLIAAPLGLARAIPPFGLIDRLAGIVPGLVKGGLAAVVLVAILLVQGPPTAIGGEIRASGMGDRLAQAGSMGFERATSWTGQDLHAITARDVQPGQIWAGAAQMPSGNLRPDGALEDAAWDLIAAAREREGLPGLRRDRDLLAIARAHALDARGAENRRLSASIEDVGDRLAAENRNCLAVGAVLATGSTAAELVDSLLASEPHRDVLLSHAYVYAGIGAVAGASGEAILVGVFVF